MGSVNNKQIRNHHARLYIQAVFETRLREEGFACPDDKLLCWYRLNPDGILNSICFFSRWPNLPLMLEIGYGIHPLFVKPFFSNDIYISNVPNDERFYSVMIEDDGAKKHFAPYAPDVLVYSPQTTGHGIDVLDRVILPQMNSINTVDACYRFHRKMFRSPTFGMSSTMIDEAIIINDIVTMENCQRNVAKMIAYYYVECSKYPNKKEYRDKLLYAKLQKAALTDNYREDYLLSLEQRSRKNLHQLRKWGICP